jgi:hypothetical protein
VCSNNGGSASCTCLPENFGDPYVACKPECIQNSDCDNLKACVRYKCMNPCLTPGACGINAVCEVYRHVISCSCEIGYTGQPLSACYPIPQRIETTPSPRDPCSPSPCGPDSICRVQNGIAICSCKPDYFGVPPQCRPECIVRENSSFQLEQLLIW